MAVTVFNARNGAVSLLTDAAQNAANFLTYDRASGARRPLSDFIAQPDGPPLLMDVSTGRSVTYNQAGGVTPLPFAVINTVGWNVDYTATPGALQPGQAFSVSRQGFDAAGATASYTDTLTATQRVRQLYPNSTGYNPSTWALTPLTVALSDYVYSTDTVIGVTNNSTEASPRPVVQWAQMDRRVTGNSLVVDLVAFHRNGRSGKPVAFVSGTATDGTNTANAVVTGPLILGHSGDKNPVIGYRLTFDLTALTDNSAITVNAKVYPWIGTSTSVADSSTGTADARGFVPQVYYKSTSKAANPPLVYVNTATGVDAVVLASGATAGSVQKVSTTAATASANPFATIKSALEALKAATTITGGFTDGCIVNLMQSGGNVPLASGTNVTAGTYQTAGAVIIQSDPAGSQATLVFGAVNYQWYQQRIHFRNIAMSRTGGSQGIGFYGTTGTLPCKFMFENCALDNNSVAFPLTVQSGNQPALYFMGLSLTNPGTAISSSGTYTMELRLLRGATWTATNVPNIQVYTVLGCTSSGHFTRATDMPFNSDGTIVSFNKFNSIGLVNSTPLDFGTTAEATARGLSGVWTITGIAVVQNVFEYIGTSSTSSATIRFSGDNTSDSASVLHGIAWNNTFVGFGNQGRNNMFYDENTAVLRNHRLMSSCGNIHTQINNKGDLFVALDPSEGPNPGDAPNHFGHMAYSYGVGSHGEAAQFIDAGNGNFAQAYGGVKSSIGTTLTAPTVAFSTFTNYQGPTSATVAGAGGGTYTLQSGSPFRGVLTTAEEVLPFDLAGTARSAGAIGAYA